MWLGNDSSGYLLIYPVLRSAPPVNEDAPKGVQQYYDEAADIAARSPRAAAALLRLAIQVLIEELLGKKCDINEGIAELVRRGLPPTLQQAFDVVRLTGNDAVHPGQIDTDAPETVVSLFPLVNLIVEKMITEPRQIAELYQGMPEEKLKGIERRDGV